ncbi:hypothetical protein B0O99DRAFT_656762 [Bisporella sp. PMI_857]|nr:hypothetical protein B0O99DRAFT_656762 [Bisporella sp. PMI_857]
MARSTGLPQRLRNEESWVEITSHPSSSSMSSIGDEIITTGLRVQQRPNSKRRRGLGVGGASPITLEARNTGTSSQEEYEESESEEDHVMTSSNEYPPAPRLSSLQQTYNADSEDDDDENATALGRRTEPVFTPQPNAFSHPPSHRSSVPGSYFPRTSESAPSRPAYLHRTSSRGQYHSHNQVDHDAALRASLTTLLSIGAAAARGLPKRNQGPPVASNQPMSLGLVPESELIGDPIAPNSSRPLTPSPRARSSPSIASEEIVESSKRKAKPVPEKTRLTKKKKVQLVEDALISPTLMTWVMSAGVVVLVSVVGFGAGYVIGREVGRGEGLASLNGTAGNGVSCGREVVRSTGSLKKLKWGSGVARRIVA